MLLSDLLPAAIGWQPAAGDLVLLGVDAGDLAIAETVVATLPAKARGQVFVEVADENGIRPIIAPGRVCVSWLRRDLGQSLAVAVDAWLAEMLPTEADREHHVYAWLSGEANAGIRTSD